MKNRFLDLQAKECKNGQSVSGSENSSDDADASDLSYVSPTRDHADAERHVYLDSLASQNGLPTPIHLQRRSDQVFDGREGLVDILMERMESRRLALKKCKADDPIAYAQRKAVAAAAKIAREAQRLARKHGKIPCSLYGDKENVSLVAIASGQVPKHVIAASPKVVIAASPKVVREIIHINSDSEPPIPPRMQSPAARADTVQQKLHHIFRPFCRDAASKLTLTHEVMFHARLDHSLTSPKVVANVQPPSPPIAVAGCKNADLGPPLLITPLKLFPISVAPTPLSNGIAVEKIVDVFSKSPHSSPSHWRSPVARSPLVLSRQGSDVHQSLVTTFSDVLLANKKPDLRPSPASHPCDPLIPAEKKFLRNRLKLKRNDSLFCTNSELCADTFNAAVQTSPQSAPPPMTHTFIAALVNAAVQTTPRTAIDEAVQTSSRLANVAVQTSPRFALQQSFDDAVQTSPRLDLEKPVTARELRSAIHELLVGLGFHLY